MIPKEAANSLAPHEANAIVHPKWKKDAKRAVIFLSSVIVPASVGVGLQARFSGTRDRSVADVQLLKQQAAEAESETAFKWIAALKDAKTDEQRRWVLELAIATTPYESVKAWARRQLAILDRRVEQTGSPEPSAKAPEPATTASCASAGGIASNKASASATAAQIKEAPGSKGVPGAREPSMATSAACKISTWPRALVPDVLAGERKDQTDSEVIAAAEQRCANERKGTKKLWEIELDGATWRCACQ